VSKGGFESGRASLRVASNRASKGEQGTVEASRSEQKGKSREIRRSELGFRILGEKTPPHMLFVEQ
jgi:hypothetical protein